MEELGRGPPLPGVEFGQCSDFFSFFVLTFVCLFFLLVLFCLFFRIFLYILIANSCGVASIFAYFVLKIQLLKLGIGLTFHDKSPLCEAQYVRAERTDKE